MHTRFAGSFFCMPLAALRSRTQLQIIGDNAQTTGAAAGAMVSMPYYCMALLAATLIALTGAFVPTTTLRPLSTALAAKRRLADIKSSKISRKKKPRKAATAAEATSKALELGLKVMDQFQRPEFLAKPMFERLGEIVNATTAGPSPTAGTGLFAARDLPAGTLVALYPAHAIGRGEQNVFYDTNRDYFKKQTSSGSLRPYRQNVLGDRSLFGVANDQIEDPFLSMQTQSRHSWMDGPPISSMTVPCVLLARKSPWLAITGPRWRAETA